LRPDYRFLFMAGQAFAGGFTRTCAHIKLAGSVLHADCEMLFKKWAKDVTLDLNNFIGVDANNKLKWNSSGFGTLCPDKSITVTTGVRTVLKAKCRTTASPIPVEYWIPCQARNDKEDKAEFTRLIASGACVRQGV